MINYLIIALLAVTVGAAAAYIIREKKRGVKCIGCPASSNCSGICHNNCTAAAQQSDDTK